MNKLRTARLLMAATILLVIAFQAYWMRKLYKEETGNFKKTTDIVFRDAMYRLQVQRFTGDSLEFKGVLDDNLFMADFISSVEKVKEGKDSGRQKMVISMNTHTEKVNADEENTGKKIKGDTVIYISSDAKKNELPPPQIVELLADKKNINDSIPVKQVDSMYRALLAKEGIGVNFRISKSIPVMVDSPTRHFNIRMDEPTSAFSTKRVPVGLMSPTFYRAEFNDPAWYVLKKISMQLLLSFLLVLLTTVSFVFIYRTLLAQRRLTAIKNEFIGNITHELKTPIATVSVAIEAMKNFNALQNPERTKEYLGIAGQELNRLSLLVDKVLRLSMFEKQQVELKYEWFDVKDLVKEVMDSLQLQFQKYGAVVNLQLQGNDFMLMADRMHITSVIYNLLDNALKYSGSNPVIDILIAADGNEMTLQVKDNGIGIPDSYKEKVFDKFFRVPHGDKHNVKGYGLGLSYVAHIIAQHKGSISLQSEEGAGTTFIIKLPITNGGH